MNEVADIRREVAFENERGRMTGLRKALEQVQHWASAAAIRDAILRREDIVADMHERLSAKPVVTIAGPTGCGKSTLVNALIGSDNLVPMGINRPTTRDVSAIARSADDARQLLDQMPRESLHLKIAATGLTRDLILLDTPDTDSAECMQHLPLLRQALQLSDVLVCVFDVGNPKRRDNIEALADWVNAFPGQHIYLVLNRCDRLSADELEENTADFLQHISRSWARTYDRVYRISARAGLRAPNWPEGEQPRQTTNDLDDLRQQLTDLGGGSFFTDQRIERARHLNASLAQTIRENIEPHKMELQSVQADLTALDREVAETVITEVCTNTPADNGGILVMLYGALSQRWWGPVGGFLGLWRRMVDFRTPLHALRSLNPFTLVSALAQAIRAVRDHEAFESKLIKTLGSGMAQRDTTTASILLARKWPDLGDRLVRIGFDPAVREPAVFMDLHPILELSEQVWGQALKQATDRAADRLSHPLLQWMLNLPVLAGILLAGVRIVQNFALGIYLPGNFFLHTIALLLVLWLVPAFILQFSVQRARKHISARAIEHAKVLTLANREHAHNNRTILDEIKTLLQLSQADGP